MASKIGKNKYYVYALCEGDNPFYIGKGSGNRAYKYSLNIKTHNKLLNDKFNNLKKNNLNFNIKILEKNLNEKDSLLKEKYYISKYGRKCFNEGKLCNYTEGGNQPLSYDQLYKIYGKNKIDEFKNKQKQTFQNKIFERNIEKLLSLEKLLNEKYLIKDIAKILNVNRNTISNWINKYNLIMIKHIKIN